MNWKSNAFKTTNAIHKRTRRESNSERNSCAFFLRERLKPHSHQTSLLSLNQNTKTFRRERTTKKTKEKTTNLQRQQLETNQLSILVEFLKVVVVIGFRLVCCTRQRAQIWQEFQYFVVGCYSYGSYCVGTRCFVACSLGSCWCCGCRSYPFHDSWKRHIW